MARYLLGPSRLVSYLASVRVWRHQYAHGIRFERRARQRYHPQYESTPPILAACASSTNLPPPNPEAGRPRFVPANHRGSLRQCVGGMKHSEHALHDHIILTPTCLHLQEGQGQEVLKNHHDHHIDPGSPGCAALFSVRVQTSTSWPPAGSFSGRDCQMAKDNQASLHPQLRPTRHLQNCCKNCTTNINIFHLFILSMKHGLTTTPYS